MMRLLIALAVGMATLLAGCAEPAETTDDRADVADDRRGGGSEVSGNVDVVGEAETNATGGAGPMAPPAADETGGNETNTSGWGELPPTLDDATG